MKSPNPIFQKKPIVSPLWYKKTLKEITILANEHTTCVCSEPVDKVLLAHCTGEKTVQEIVELLQENYKPADVLYSLLKLQKKELVILEEIENLNAEANIQLQRKKSKLDITWHNLSIAPNDLYKVIFQKFGWHPHASKPVDLVIVLVDDYLNPDLKKISKLFLQKHQSWLPIKLTGLESWIGPRFSPDQNSPCITCLQSRLNSNRIVNGYLNALGFEGIEIPISYDNLSLNTACSALAKTLNDERWASELLYTFNTQNMDFSKHHLTPVINCPDCSVGNQPSLNHQPQIVLNSSIATGNAGGGQRMHKPEDTFKKYQHLISPHIGIVKGIQTVEEKKPIHVVMAGHNFARNQAEIMFLKGQMRGTASGKGRTFEQARAGGLAEALERYSGVFDGSEPIRRGRYSNDGEHYHPAELLQYSEHQYQHREQLNQENRGQFFYIPEPFDTSQAIDWSAFWSLTDECTRWLPTAYSYFNYPFGNQANSFCVGNSNGSAAGRTLEEAILQGFLEIIERDAVAVWFYNRLQLPAVDLDSLDDPFIHELQQAYATKNRKFWVLDLTYDFGIPVMAAISALNDTQPDVPIYGFGCHLDPKIAITRALTELSQCLVMQKNYQKDGAQQDDPEAHSWFTTACSLNKQYQYLRPTPQQLTSINDIPDLCLPDIRDNIYYCRDITKKMGHDLLVLQQTRRDVGLPVVKVAIPGLRPFWNRFAPGRLYDVPVKMGWLDKPLSENQLNPQYIYF